MKAYQNFLQEFGKYLRRHNFKWDQPAKGKDRIYFNADGYVDYYLFEFKTEIGDEGLIKYERLFARFAAKHKIGVSVSDGLLSVVLLPS